MAVVWSTALSTLGRTPVVLLRLVRLPAGTAPTSSRAALRGFVQTFRLVERRLREVTRFGVGAAAANAPIGDLSRYARDLGFWNDTALSTWLRLINARQEILCAEVCRPEPAAVDALVRDLNALDDGLAAVQRQVADKAVDLAATDLEIADHARQRLSA